MATFHFELVSPERISFSGEVDQVDVPGVEGDFGVLAGHAPLIATVRPGVMIVHAGDKKEQFVVLGGLAEVSATGLTVLADVATSVSELDRSAFAQSIEQMEADIERAIDSDALDREIARLDHFKAIQQHLESSGLH
jgi:F-type H+-transporting ATPase subunit epsilon